MCNAVNNLSPDQQQLFERFRRQLKNNSTIDWLVTIDALKEYAEVSILADSPYIQPSKSSLPLSS